MGLDWTVDWTVIFVIGLAEEGVFREYGFALGMLEWNESESEGTEKDVGAGCMRWEVYKYTLQRISVAALNLTWKESFNFCAFHWRAVIVVVLFCLLFFVNILVVVI